MSRPSSESSPTSSTLRGPPKKPKQSGHALWCGNLPAQTDIVDLTNHFSRDATKDIDSVFLISKSNCAFINYKTEASCTAALARSHDSRFQGAKLVCRLRRGPTTAPAGTPTGPRINLGATIPDQPSRSGYNLSSPNIGQEVARDTQTTTRKSEEKFFILKSLTVEDLDISVQSRLWATQSQNEANLNTAYKVDAPKLHQDTQLTFSSQLKMCISFFLPTNPANIMDMQKWYLASTIPLRI